MNWLKTVLKWRLIRALQIWNLAPVRAQGGILALIPIVALVTTFIFAIYGNNQRSWSEYDVQRRFKMMRQYNDLLSLTVDAENGVRGFLLTKRPEYLEPYQKAVNEVPQSIITLRNVINEDLSEKPRERRLENLDKIEILINQQFALLKTAQDIAAQNKSPEELSAYLQKGKNLMDEIRANLTQMGNHDGEVLGERIEEINHIRRRDYIFLFIALCVGLLSRLVSFYLFDRGIVRRINRLTENVVSINKGENLNASPPKKDDAIGLLEQEIVKIAEQKNLLNETNK